MVYAGRERHEFLIPVTEELPKINAFVQDLYASFSLTTSPLTERHVGPFATSVHKCLDDCAGIPEPSLFKVCAAITIGLMACREIGPPLPHKRISKLPKHQNAYVMIAYCRRQLHGATIFPNGSSVVLKKPLNLSSHYLYDFVELLGQAKPSPTYFASLALLYETLVYQANPKAAYPSVF